jgi:hypothetical protein
MADVFGHRWISAYGADPQGGAGQTWAAGLAGLTPPQIAAGVDACMVSADPWPPTLPQFRAMCLGIPAFPAVRARLGDFLRRRESVVVDPFDRLVWQHLDTYRVRQVSADQADRLIRDAYDIAREHVMRGGELPEPSVEIEHKAEPVKPVPPEEAAKRIEAIKAELGVRDVPKPEPEAEPVPRVNLAEVEAQLQQHYGSAQP